MRYQIDKISLEDDKSIKPCEFALYDYIGVREQQIDLYTNHLDTWGEFWLRNGHGHNENNIGSYRYHSQLGWYVNIETLYDLQKLIDTEGRIIMTDDVIAIYDDYRE